MRRFLCHSNPNLVLLSFTECRKDQIANHQEDANEYQLKHRKHLQLLQHFRIFIKNNLLALSRKINRDGSNVLFYVFQFLLEQSWSSNGEGVNVAMTQYLGLRAIHDDH